MKSASAPRRTRTVDTFAYLAAVARMIANGGARVAEADPAELKALLELREVLDEAITEAIRGLRESGTTWAEIGRVAGTTRQAALMRFGPKVKP